MKITELKLKSNKAIFRIELSILLLLLTMVIFFLIYSYVDRIMVLKHENNLVMNKQNAQDLCFLFSKTTGVPYNWNENMYQLKTIGLLDKDTQELSINKINKIEHSTYLQIQENFTSSFFNLKIENLDNGNVLLDKKVSDESANNLISSNCFAIYNNQIHKITVEVWD